jgi:protein-S-isoprenylcysteine O-methyltransferase Ste14
VSKPAAAAGTALFLLVAPGIVDGVIPWWLTHWRTGQRWGTWLPVRIGGFALIAAATAVLVHSFARFVAEGAGTPAPVAPTEHLVVGGLFQYVRNPMYLAVVAVIIGEALVLGRPALLLYAGAVLLTVAAFVHWYEEPRLRRTFGHEYAAYRGAVPGWVPRLRPWQPDAHRER